MYEEGRLEMMFLLPEEFGGEPVPENLVLVPLGANAMKADVDFGIVRELVANGQASRYAAVPRYEDRCVVPRALTISATDPGTFETTIELWGA